MGGGRQKTVCLLFPHDLGYAPLSEIFQKLGSHLLSASNQEAHDAYLPINGYVPFDHLVKVVSARFLQCKIASVTFLISVLWRDTLRLYKYPVSHYSFAC